MVYITATSKGEGDSMLPLTAASSSIAHEEANIGRVFKYVAA